MERYTRIIGGILLSLKNEFRYLSSQLVDESRARNSSSSFLSSLWKNCIFNIRIAIKLT